MEIKDGRELEFAIFCVEGVAEYLKRDVKEALAFFINLPCMNL